MSIIPVIAGLVLVACWVKIGIEIYKFYDRVLFSERIDKWKFYIIKKNKGFMLRSVAKDMCIEISESPAYPIELINLVIDLPFNAHNFKSELNEFLQKFKEFKETK
jgi:hypothetical protein